MDSRFIDREDVNQCLARLMEECGEVIAASGKTARFGFDSYNPKLREEDRVLNKDWLQAELDDLKDAISDMENHLKEMRKNGEWVKWHGADRPVSPDTIVSVRVKGDIPRVPVRAGDWPQICWRWRHEDDPKSMWNIVAYKVEG